MDELTKTQQEVLKLLEQYEIDNDGWYPTLREILEYEDCPVSSTSSLSYVINTLEVLGYVERRAARPAIRITTLGKDVLAHARKNEPMKLNITKYITPFQT